MSTNTEKNCHRSFNHIKDAAEELGVDAEKDIVQAIPFSAIFSSEERDEALALATKEYPTLFFWEDLIVQDQTRFLIQARENLSNELNKT